MLYFSLLVKWEHNGLYSMLIPSVGQISNGLWAHDDRAVWHEMGKRVEVEQNTKLIGLDFIGYYFIVYFINYYFLE